MHSEDDRARFIAAVTLAANAAAVKHRDGDSIEVWLGRMSEAVRGLNWQVTVARNLELSTSRWFERPWHCYKLRKLVRELGNDDYSGTDDLKAMEMLTRCAAMIEFGVDVSAHWYWALREAVVDQRITARKLRALLRCTTVWWGTNVSASGNQSSPMRAFQKLWTRGRPNKGELHVEQHHWITRALVTLLLSLSAFAFGIVTFALIHHLAANGSARGAAQLIAASFIYGAVLWWAVWVGPQSWGAVRTLKKVLYRKWLPH